MTTNYETDPKSHAARHGVTCRNCGGTWPCPAAGHADHTPSLIPYGATITTCDDLDRLIYYGSCTVVLDRDSTPWILFCTEDGDAYATTAPCPDDGIPGLISLEGLPARGPLLVVFNGDRDHLFGRKILGARVRPEAN